MKNDHLGCRSRARLCAILPLAVVTPLAGCAKKGIRKPRLQISYRPARAWLKEGTQTRVTPSVKRLAEKLRGDDPWVTLRRIHRWVVAHASRQKKNRGELLRNRTASQLLASRKLTGCGDWGVLLAALFRGAGIPTVYVEAIKKDWARRWADGTVTGSHAGHVFLEVFVDGKWILIDSTEGSYWRGYDRSDPNLPRGYYAFAKGKDPWSFGVKSYGALKASLEAIAEQMSLEKLKEPDYEKGHLTPWVVLVGPKKVAKRIRRSVKGARFVRASLKRLRAKPELADGRDVLVFFPKPSLASKLSLLEVPLAIENRSDLMDADPAAYPKLIRQKRRVICITTAKDASGLVKAGQAVLELKDTDGKLLRPGRCGRASKEKVHPASETKPEESEKPARSSSMGEGSRGAAAGN